MQFPNVAVANVPTRLEQNRNSKLGDANVETANISSRPEAERSKSRFNFRFLSPYPRISFRFFKDPYSRFSFHFLQHKENTQWICLTD